MQPLPRPQREVPRRVLISALVALLTLIGLTVPAAASTEDAGRTPTTAESQFAEDIFHMVNQTRLDHGLRPLKAMTGLDAVAFNWSVEMSVSGVMAHNPTFQRQYPSGSTRAGENVAYGQRSASAMFIAWMNSSGHRQNILDPLYTHLGVGVAFDRSGTPYGTQNFATYRIEVIPQPPVFEDFPGFVNDAFVIPRVEGVRYYTFDRDGRQREVGPGRHLVGEWPGTVTIAAVSANGSLYEIDPRNPRNWWHFFNSDVYEPAPDPEPTPTPPTPTPEPEPDPEPVPTPEPEPTPTPAPKPSPQPSPSPGIPGDNGSSTNRIDDGGIGGTGREFHLANGFTGKANHIFGYGNAGGRFYVGDWNGDGKDTLAYRIGNTFYIRNANSAGRPNTVIHYGRPGDRVYVGDWDGDGRDTFAVRRGRTYHVKNSLTGGPADQVIHYGREGDTVLVGDWDGDGDDTFAVRRGRTYHVKNRIAGGDADKVVHYGRPGDDVYVGDWNGNGRDSFAVRRDRTYFIKNAIAGGDADRVLVYGRSSDTTLVGDWNGDGKDTLGIRR